MSASRVFATVDRVKEHHQCNLLKVRRLDTIIERHMGRVGCSNSYAIYTWAHVNRVYAHAHVSAIAIAASHCNMHMHCLVLMPGSPDLQQLALVVFFCSVN